MKKKYKTIFLIITILLSLSNGFINFRDYRKNAIDSSLLFSADSASIPFVYGVPNLLNTIDPQNCWDESSMDVLFQVVETLFTYTLSDPTLPIMPLLAAEMGTWDVSHTNYTVNLRTGVTFHDGSTFDADDVVFSFDRQAWLYNFTGLNTGGIPLVRSLYVYPNGTQIIKDVVKVDSDTVRFELNGVYAPFEDLLCYTASSILTDTYYNETGGIVELDGDVVGTGPFVYDSYEEDVEVTLHAYDNYWRGYWGGIDNLVFSEIEDPDARNAALLTGDIHFLKDPVAEFVDMFTDDPDIAVINTGDTGGTFQYLVMNNMLINRTWREAISYAFNYDYLINTTKLGYAIRMKSPIPMGFKYSNWTFPVPIYNLTKARIIMQSMGYGEGFNLDDDAEWVAATETSPFRTFNYSYNIGSELREDVYTMLIRDLKKIGIRVTDAGSDLITLTSKMFEWNGYTRNHLELLLVGWGPDYNDASDFINPLFTNRSEASNIAQYDGYLEAGYAGRDPENINDNVQLLMEQALITPDGPAREVMYDRIQELLINDSAHVWAYCLKVIFAHHVALTGFLPNVLNWPYFYTCQWAPERNLFIEVTDSNFSLDEFNLTYSVYNKTNHGISDATFQMWWNGSDVSSNVQNLGGGTYFTTFEPITVEPGEEPILLNMTISANGYSDKYFELELAVDPLTLSKGTPGDGKNYLVLIIIVVSVGILGLILVSLLVVSKKRKPPKVKPSAEAPIEKKTKEMIKQEAKVDKYYNKATSLIDTANKFAQKQEYSDAIETLNQAQKQIKEAKEIVKNYNLIEYKEKIKSNKTQIKTTIAYYQIKIDEQKVKEKKTKTEEELQERMSFVDSLIKANELDKAIENLTEIQNEAQTFELIDLVNAAEEKILICKKSQVETINRIKQTILTLGAKFTRLQLVDISEKSGIIDETIIENVIQDMIKNKEIQGEYFSSSKALALEAAVLIPKEEIMAKHNVFISYSTLDTDYFQVSRIVRRLELYPEIDQVLFWEVDSKQNIVEFMEETLKKTNVFVLFCSENSIKSDAVKGEWQSAYQMVKKGLMKIIPVYEDEDHIPRLLWQMLNVKFTKDDFEGFIQNLYEEILR
ncbi:MAG: ABC transporter substrate-binding protein [Promethearchaeota archaeon]